MYYDLEKILKRKEIVRQHMREEEEKLKKLKPIIDKRIYNHKPCRRLVVVNIETGDCEALTSRELAKRLKVKSRSFKEMIGKQSFKQKYVIFAYEDQIYEWAEKF